MIKILVAVVLTAFAMILRAEERLFAIDKAGFLCNSNRFALATFSKATLTVVELEGELKLPCRFSFVPGIGKDRCTEINFSSTLVESSRKRGEQPGFIKGKVVASDIPAIPKKLHIAPLVLDVSEYPSDVDIVATQGGVGGTRDMVLYQKVPEKYYRHLCSSETDREYWSTLMLGKRIEYRIWPVCCTGEEFVVEYNDIKSKYFSKMTLTYSRCGEDFRLTKVIITGDYSYKGVPLKADPASCEICRCFAKSSTRYLENHENGIVETGCGVLNSQQKVKYTVYDQTADERFKVVIEVWED